MLTICSDKVKAFDVDDTLVFQHPPASYPLECDFVISFNGNRYPLWIHKAHVEKIKELKASGHTIIVWSQQGYAWADAVVKNLGLFNFVDLVMTKPDECYDDLGFEYWLKRSFIGENKNGDD